MDGFWVRAIMALAQVYVASQMGVQHIHIDPHVDATCGHPTQSCSHEVSIPLKVCVEQRYCDVYLDGKNGWEEFWEPVDGITSQTFYSKLAGDESSIIELHHKFAWLIYAQFFRYPSRYSEAVQIRLRMADLVRRYAVVQADVIQRADREWEHLMDGERFRPVIGVQVRGTDKGRIIYRPIHHPSLYFSMIDRFLSRFPDSLVFLATDDDVYADVLTRRYGQRLVQQSHQVFRTSGNKSIWRANRKSSAQVAPLGLQVLLDTLLLARCSFLLKTDSAVSEFALYYNPHLINNSYDFAIPDNPLPSWVNA